MPAQPSNAWSIQLLNADGSNAGAAATLASLGMESAEYDLNNLAADVLTLTVGGAEFDAAALWPYGQLLALLKPDGTRAFFGRVEPWTRSGQPDAQNHLGRVVNPWWYLARKIYEQRYTITNFTSVPVIGQPNPPTTTTTYSTPRVVLNILFDSDAGAGFYSATTGQQIADAVNWAISQGAPIRLGTVDPATTPFSDFQKGIFCEDVIKLMFRKEPDFVVDWDYSTTPFPTVHFRKPSASLAPLNIDLTNVSVREQVEIKERPDWQRSYVKINYDETDSTTGGSYLATYADWYSAAGQGNSANGVASGAALPADTESRFRGVDLFCDLTGSAQTTVSHTATFASVAFDPTSLVTWARWKPALAAPNVASVVILGPGTVPPSGGVFTAPAVALVDEEPGAVLDPNCVFEITSGSWADWIPNSNAQLVRVTAHALVTLQDGSRHVQPLSHDCTLTSINTNGASKDFTQSNTTTTSYAEPVPQGLAKAMWMSWKNLAIEGRFQNVEAVIGAGQAISRKNSLNFLTANPGQNGRPDWRAVNALIQNIRGDIARGTTLVQFGAPLHLTGHELIDAVRATRYRVTTVDLGYLFGGALGGGAANLRHPRKTHARHSQHGLPSTQVQTISANPAPVPGTDAGVTHNGGAGSTTWSPPNGPAASVKIDPSAAKGSDGNWHTIQLREQKVCVTNSDGSFSQRTVLALTSETYQAPDDPT